jgi:hypothetical protein
MLSDGHIQITPFAVSHLQSPIRTADQPIKRPQRLLLQGVLETADGVLDLALNVVDLALGLKLGIAGHLADGLLDRTLDFFSRAGDLILIHYLLIPWILTIWAANLPITTTGDCDRFGKYLDIAGRLPLSCALGAGSVTAPPRMADRV